MHHSCLTDQRAARRREGGVHRAHALAGDAEEDQEPVHQRELPGLH